MSYRQVRRQVKASTSKVPAKRARYSDTSISLSGTTYDQLASPQSSDKSFQDGGGNHTSSAYKDLGGRHRDEKDHVQMPVVKIPRTDLSILRAEKRSFARRSTRNEQPSKKSVNRGKSSSVKLSPTKSAFEGNGGSSGRGKSKQQAHLGQVIVPSKNPLNLALGLGQLDPRKASPFSLTAQFHKVMESISNSESSVSVRRKKLSARKSTSSRSGVPFKAFTEMARSKSDNLPSHSVQGGEKDTSSPLSSSSRQVVAVDEEVSFSLPAKSTTEQEPKPRTGSSLQHAEVINAKGERVYQMAARKVYPYQMKSRHKRSPGKKQEIKSPFLAARKSAPFSHGASVKQRHPNAPRDTRAHTSTVQDISLINVESQKGSIAARKSYPIAIKRVKNFQDSVPQNSDNQNRIVAARKSFLSVLRSANSSRNSASSDLGIEERPVAARKSYPAASDSARDSLQEPIQSHLESQKQRVAARKHHPYSSMAARDYSHSHSPSVRPSHGRGMIERKSSSDGYLSVREQGQDAYLKKTTSSSEKTKLHLAAKKTAPYSRTKMIKDSDRTSKTGKAPTTSQLKCGKKDSDGMVLIKKKSGSEQISPTNIVSYDMAQKKQDILIIPSIAGKSPAALPLTGQESEADRMDVCNNQSSIIPETARHRSYSLEVTAEKIDPSQQTLRNRGGSSTLQKTARKTLRGSYLNSTVDGMLKTANTSVSQQQAQERKTGLYGGKRRTGLCSVPLVDATRDVAISIGTHLRSDSSRSDSTGDGGTEMAAKETEKVLLHQKYDGKSVNKKDSTKPTSCSGKTEVNSRTSRRCRGEKSKKCPSFDTEDTTEVGSLKFHIVTLGQSPVSAASPVTIPRSKYARQSLQSSSTHYHGRENIQSKQKYSQKEKILWAKPQGKSSPALGRYVSKPSVDCKVNDGWKVLSIGKVTQKQISRKEKDSVYSTGRKKSQEVDSDESSNIADSSLEEYDDDDGGGQVGIMKKSLSKSDNVPSEDSEFEASDPSCQDRNIFDMFKIPVSNKNTTAFPPKSLEKKSELADNALETGQQTTVESSNYNITSVIKKDTLVPGSSLKEQKETDTADRVKDAVQRKSIREDDLLGLENIEKLEKPEVEKKLSSSLQMECVSQGALTVDDAELLTGTSSSQVVKEPVVQSQGNSETLPSGIGSKGEKESIAKSNTLEELPQSRRNITKEPKVVYTSLRRMTRSERERIKAAEKNVAKWVGKELDIVVTKIPTVTESETHLETEKKDKCCAEFQDKDSVPSVKDNKGEVVEVRDENDQNVFVASESDRVKVDKKESSEKTVGILEEISGPKQLLQATSEPLEGMVDDEDALGEAIADFLDDKDVDRIELNSSSYAIGEGKEVKEDCREEEIHILQREKNTPGDLGSNKEKMSNMQDEENVSTCLENISENVGKESKKEGLNEAILDPLPKTEDEEEEDSRNIFAIFQKTDKEEMLSPSKEKRDRITVKDSERSTQSSEWDDMKDEKKANATLQGKSNSAVIEEGFAETHLKKRNILQMLQSVTGDRKASMPKTPVLNAVEELPNATEKSDRDVTLATSTSMSGISADDESVTHDGATKKITVEADTLSSGAIFANPEEKSCPQSFQDSSRKQEKVSVDSGELDPEKKQIKAADSVVPSDSAPEHCDQRDPNVEQKFDEHPVMGTLLQSQTAEDADKDSKGKNNADDKNDITGEKSAMDVGFGGLKGSSLVDSTAADGLMIHEDGVDGGATRDEDEVSKQVEGDLSESEVHPPLLQPYDASDEKGRRLAESSEESACMPIIVSVSSVNSSDGFLNPSSLKRAEDVIHPEESSVTTLGSFGSDQGLDSSVEDTSLNDGDNSMLPSQKNINPEQRELLGTNLVADEYTASMAERSSATTNADSNEAGEIDIIDGISFMSFSTKEEILAFMNSLRASKKGKAKKKPVMTSVWATSKKKKKPVKKTPPKPVHSIFPAGLKEHSQKCIDDYQEKFLKDLRKQKRKEILHPALLKRGVSIKRSLDCGIPLLIDLELLDIKLDEEILKPKKDKNHSEICLVPEEPIASSLDDEGDVITTEDGDGSDGEVMAKDGSHDIEVGAKSNKDIAERSTDGESQEQNEDLKEAQERSTSSEPAGKEHQSVIQDKVLAKEHDIFKPFEKPVLSQKSAFFSSELDTYLNKLEEEKRGHSTPKSPKSKGKQRPSRSRHMDKLSSAIQEIPFSSLFRAKQKDSDAPSKTVEVVKSKSIPASLLTKVGKNVDSTNEANTFLAPPISKTRIGTTILKKSTAGSMRFRGPLPTVKDVPKKNKGHTDLPPNTSIIFLKEGANAMKAPRRNRQSTFLDRLVSNVKRATEAEKKVHSGLNRWIQSEETPKDMSSNPVPSRTTNEPMMGTWVSPNEVLPVESSSSSIAKPPLSTFEKSQKNISVASKQRRASEKNLLEYFEEDPQPRHYDDLPGVTPDCGNDFCRLGCICSSLETKFDEISPEHCRKLECMLECKCERFPSLRILRARKRPAIFHQDGMVFYDEAGLLSEADDRKRRRLDPNLTVDRGVSAQEKNASKKIPKSSPAVSVLLKQAEQKIEEVEKATTSTPKPTIKLQRKEPGFARGRVYVAKHIRQAAKQEGQDPNGLGGSDVGSKNVVPPVKVVRTVDGYCVKPATNSNQTGDPDAEEALEERFKLLKRVDRMLFLSQRYKQKAQSLTRRPSKDSEQEQIENPSSQSSQAGNSSLSSEGDVSGASANPGVCSSGTERRVSQDSLHAEVDAATKISSSDAEKVKGDVAHTIYNQVHKDGSKDLTKEGDVVKSKPNTAPRSFNQKNSVAQEVIDNIESPTKAKSLKKVPIPPLRPYSGRQHLQFHEYKPTDVEILADSGGGKTQTPASSQRSPISASTFHAHLKNSKSKQGLTTSTTISQSGNMTTKQSVAKSHTSAVSETLQTYVSGINTSVGTCLVQVQSPVYANPKFRQGLTSHTLSTSPPSQRVMVTGGKIIVQQQAHRLLLQQSHGGGQFISLPVQPSLHPSKQLHTGQPLIPVAQQQMPLAQQQMPLAQQQIPLAQQGGPSKDKLIMLPSNKPGKLKPPLLQLPQAVIDGKADRQLILLPHGKSLGTSLPGVAKKDTNCQAFLVQTSDGKGPMLLVPVQPKISEQPTNSGFLLLPSSEGTVSVAEQLKLKREKAKQKELEDCYGLKAYNCSQQGVIRPLRELAGYVAAKRRHFMDPRPFQKKESLFIPNTHLMNPNKAFHLLVDVYSNCHWEQQRQGLLNTIFKMASKIKVPESVLLDGYRVVRISFIKHAQKAKSINVSSSVARNCTQKIRIIGLFQSEFKICLNLKAASDGNITNSQTKIALPSQVGASQSTSSGERSSCNNQNEGQVPPKQGHVTGEEKETKERSYKKDAQGLRKKVNILRTVRHVEQKEESTKSVASTVNLNTEKKDMGGKNAGECLIGKEDCEILPSMPEGIVPGCSGKLAPVRKLKVLRPNLTKHNCTSGEGTPGNVKGGCMKQTEGDIIGQEKKSVEQSIKEMPGKATQKGIEPASKSMVESPIAVNGRQGDNLSSNLSKELCEGDGPEDTVQSVNEQADEGSTAKMAVVALHQSLESIRSDGIEKGENVKSCVAREGGNGNSDEKTEGPRVNSKMNSGDQQKMEEGKESGEAYNDMKAKEGEDVNLDGKAGCMKKSEMNSGSQQRTMEGMESDKTDKDTEVHTEKNILETQMQREAAPGTNLEKKLLKGSDETVKESCNLQSKERTNCQNKPEGEDKSKDGNEIEILPPCQEITDVQDQEESSENLSGQNELSGLLEKETEVRVKKDVCSEVKTVDKCISTSSTELRLVRGEEEKRETKGIKDVLANSDCRDDGTLRDRNDDCTVLDDDKDCTAIIDSQKNHTDSKENPKDTPLEGQEVDGARSLHNLVANLSNRVSDVGDEEIKIAEKQQGVNYNLKEEDTVSSCISSEDEVTSSDSESGSDSESAEEETGKTSKRREWFSGAKFCTIHLSTIVEKCFSGSVPFAAKWPEGYLDKRCWAEGMPKSKKVHKTSFLDGCLIGKGLAWPLKPKKKEVKFMSPDSLSNLYKKREEQRREEKIQRAKRLAHDRRQFFKSLPPSQRLPKKDKVKSLEYCVVDKREPVLSDEDLDVLGCDDDDDEYCTTDDDSIYSDSSYEDEQRSKNEALFSLAVIPSFAGRFKALLEKRGALEYPPTQNRSPESRVSPVDRSETQSPLVPEVRDQLYLKDTDFASSGDESDSSIDVEKWSDTESGRANFLKIGTKETFSDNMSMTSDDQSRTSSPSRSKKRKADVKEKRKGALNEKETFVSLCVQHSPHNKDTSSKSDKDNDDLFRGAEKHEIHIFKERRRRAEQKSYFKKLGEAVFDPAFVMNKPKIAILRKAYEVIQEEKKRAKALDEELSAQRFCHYTLRTNIKKLLRKYPHLGNLMCNPVETPTVVENIAERMVKEGSFSGQADKSIGQPEKNSVFKNLLPEPSQPAPFDVAQSAKKLLGGMKMCMARAANKEDSVCHWTIQSMLDSGNEKLPSYLRTEGHMGRPVIDFESEHYIISQKIQHERAKRWQRKKRAMMKQESRLRIGSFINAKGSGGLVFTKGVTPSVRKQTLEKSSKRSNDQENEESDSVNLSPDSPASSIVDATEDNESSRNSSSSDNDSDDDDDSLAGSLVCIAQPDEYKDSGTSTKNLSEEGHSEEKEESKEKDKSSKKRKRSDSSSEDDDDPSPFSAFVIDESVPSEGEDGWIDDEPHPEDGWEEEKGMGASVAKAVEAGHQKVAPLNACTGDLEGGKSVSIDKEKADPKKKDVRSVSQGSKQDSTSSDMSDINVDVRKIIPCLQVEEKDDGTLDVVLQGEFSDERLDELFARPGVMDYLRKVAAQKKKTRAKPSESGK